jgi:hypothetical protein
VWGWLPVLGIALTAQAQLKVGDSLEMRSNAVVTVGYQGSYGNEIQSNHGLELGFEGTVTGDYYSPNFLNFQITPYYNQARTNSDSGSLTNASGVTATANLFTGSHTPGSVTYNYTYNSTGTFGFEGVPAFTTVGNSQGFGINWSALFPDWPTLTVGYTHGSGNGTLFGTDQTANSSSSTLTLRSNYSWRGWNSTAYYDHLAQHSNFPLFLVGQQSVSNTSGNDVGFGTGHELPWNGQIYANYNRSSYSSDYQGSTDQQVNTSNYTTSYQTVGATFHPTLKLSLFGSESYVSDLSGYLTQTLGSNGNLLPPVNLGSNSYSFTAGGGATYSFTPYLSGSGQATYYQQSYFNNTYTGTYVSGTINYLRRLWNTFTFSAGVVDSYNGQGSNAVGFVGNVNGYRHFGTWEISGNFSYAQNVQSQLITYTTSSYNYSANVHRRFARQVQWTTTFNGSHSGLNQQPDTSNHSEAYATTLAYRWISGSAFYTNVSGTALFLNGGFVPLPPLPGEPSNLTAFSGHSYGGSVSLTPVNRLSIAGTFTRSISDTLSNSILSHNNTELIDAQLRYRFRRVGLQAGYDRYNQGFTALGTGSGIVNAYFVGISRYFDFF